MMDYANMLREVAEIQYKDWIFNVSMDGPRPVLQLEMPGGWKSRKWLLSPHMTTGEFVQTCFKAVLTAEEHEARERFLYKSVPVLGPHIDIVELLAAAVRTKKRTG